MKPKHAFPLILIVFVLQNSFGQIPTWNWARSGTGNGYIEGSTVTTDSFGNIYVSGYFSSENMTIGTVTLQNAVSSFNDLFLAKYDPSGNLLWAQRYGGSSNDRGTSVTTDKAGNVYLTGYFYSPKIGFGTDTLTNAGNVGDIFIVKFDGLGNVIWAKREGAAALEIPHSIHVDSNNNIIVTGRFSSNVITFGTTILTLAGSMDVFIVKYDAYGNLLWAKGAGGGSNDEGYSLSTDDSGNIYVSGYFTQPARFGTIQLISDGQADMFLAKYDPSGNVLWAKRAGGKGDDRATSVKTDASGNSYITGYYTNYSISFASVLLPNEPGDNSFLAKYDTNGNVLWAIGVGGDSQALDLTLFNSDVYVCGSFQADKLVYGTTNLIINGNSDFFILNCDTDGKPNWAIKQTSEGKSGEIARSLTTDNIGNVIITGLFSSEPITFGTTNLNSERGFNMFIARLGTASTGTKNLSNSGEFYIFPNPGNGQFTLETKEIIHSMEVFSISGTRVYSMPNLNQQIPIKINLSEFSPGVYFVRVNIDKKQYTQKLILQSNR